jgi:hypothetical protein
MYAAYTAAATGFVSPFVVNVLVLGAASHAMHNTPT